MLTCCLPPRSDRETATLVHRHLIASSREAGRAEGLIEAARSVSEVLGIEIDAARENQLGSLKWRSDRVQAAKFPQPERGHYSLIQFVHDRGRAEGANGGVVVVCPNLAASRVLMCENNDGPTRHFGEAVVDEARLDSAKNALERRLRAELLERPTLQTLERARSLEGNALAITSPRSVLVDDIDRVSARSLDELVRIPRPTTPPTPHQDSSQ